MFKKEGRCYTGQRCLCKVGKDCRCDSESLEELLELPDELCIHGLHQDPEALVPHQGLLSLQLLIDKLLERNAVHRVLQGQLRRDRENKEITVRMASEGSPSQLSERKITGYQRY